MNTNHTGPEASATDLARLNDVLAQHRRALKYLRVMAGSKIDLNSTREVGMPLDPNNDDSQELLARYRHIVEEEQKCLRLIAQAQLG